MSYLVLARKYRPQTFDDVIGQDHITNSLKKAVESNRVHHAYLFCGPRGVGKTTCARILAKELNRVKATNQAEMLDLDSDLDIIEIDGASNRGIDEIRTLRENVKFVPMSGRYKIYIIDEVHMLTTEAFNALLKTLEEPPEHVKFIFATTDPNKLPLTVVSRCEPYYFKRIPLDIIVGKMKDICVKEGFKAEEEALYLIAKAAQGSMRDALSVLDQLISFSDGTVLTADVNGMLGVVETQYIFDIADAVATKDCTRALTTLDAVIAQGKDIKYLSQNLVEHFRHLMVMKVGGKQLEALIDYPKAHKETLFAQTGNMTIQAILRAIDTLIDAQDTARVTESPRIALELALAKLTCVETPSLSQPVQPSAKPAAPTASARPTGTTAAPKPVVRSSVPPKPTGPAVSGGSVISNKKGSLDLSPLEIPAVPSDSGKSSISLADLKQRWNELTFAVSQKRMSTGTYLQEGFPSTLENGKLVIAFSREHKFHKECLGTVENLNLIAEVFAGILGERFFVELVVVDNAVRDGSAEVKDALEMFRGEVVNEWHSEDA